ncbi:uncharacterized protein LOC143198441 isoform X2 [Rhynchophorus ferrugineus]|uniref:uncharacterized protein LOC143198441 isoform X2 n=1 Tax=Rhynchophorus ferrugineus TaxID=354439 RepID=UPI003FCDCE78
MSISNISDFSKICRLCLKQNINLLNIFHSGGATIISKIFSMQPSEDDFLPKNICISCMDKCTQYLEFRHLCENNNEYLLSVLNNKIKDADIDNVSELVKVDTIDVKHQNLDLPCVITSSQEPKAENSNIDLFSCNYCQLNFNEKESESEHKKVYHPYDDEHYCYICVKDFSLKYTDLQKLKNHLYSHKNPSKITCEYCDKKLRSNYDKNIHLRVHTGEKPIKCSQCKKSFRDPRYLMVHLKTHSDEKSYKCLICNKAFSQKFTLNTHQKTHTMERNYMCNLCGKTFVYSHNLKIHYRKHSGEKPYKCKLCTRCFSSSSILSAHMLTHSETRRFSCKDCGKQFKRSGDLSVHNRSHTGEKPYTCTFCPNKYKMSSHLTEHIKKHTAALKDLRWCKYSDRYRETC